MCLGIKLGITLKLLPGSLLLQGSCHPITLSTFLFDRLCNCPGSGRHFRNWKEQPQEMLDGEIYFICPWGKTKQLAQCSCNHPNCSFLWLSWVLSYASDIFSRALKVNIAESQDFSVSFVHWTDAVGMNFTVTKGFIWANNPSLLLKTLFLHQQCNPINVYSDVGTIKSNGSYTPRQVCIRLQPKGLSGWVPNIFFNVHLKIGGHVANRCIVCIREPCQGVQNGVTSDAPDLKNVDGI